MGGLVVIFRCSYFDQAFDIGIGVWLRPPVLWLHLRTTMASSSDGAHITGEASQLSAEENQVENLELNKICRACEKARHNATGPAADNDLCRPCWRKANTTPEVLCQGCQKPRWNEKGAAAHNNYCKLCWKQMGTPPEETCQSCKEPRYNSRGAAAANNHCKECWNRNDRPRTEDECRICKSYMGLKCGRKIQLCKSCCWQLYHFF